MRLERTWLMSTRKKLILDCDPGHDDAIALLLAYGNPDVELVAVTTVAGNQTLEKVTRNALGVAAIAGIAGVPFAAGAARPLVRPLEVAESIHGVSGLDGVMLPEATVALDRRHAVTVIIDEIMSHDPQEITLVATGALTNVALAARIEPRIVQRLSELVLMGGGYHTGNWSAVAEFNMKVDPEAAHIVFNAGWPLTMVGLDLTYQALATPEVIARIAELDTGPTRFVCQLLKFFAKTYKEQQGFASPPVHDPCAVARVIDPSVMTVKRAPVDIELTGSLTLGMTVADFRRPAPPDCKTQVAVKLDQHKLWDLVQDALIRIGDPGVSR